MKASSFRIQQAIEQLQIYIQSMPYFTDIVTELQNNGAQVYIVGGIVRDVYMGLPLGDIDVEIHDIEARQLEVILQQFGTCSLVGASFGVYKLYGVDWSLPRHDVRVAHDGRHPDESHPDESHPDGRHPDGRHPQIQIDIHLDIREAARRRDLTINALMYDMQNNIIHDFFGSFDDCDRRLLRSPDVQFFADDPLRFFRVMHFVGRFDAFVDAELFEMCKTMNISDISRERVEQELYKLFLYSHFPSRGFRFLHDCGQLQKWFAEIAVLVNVKQLPQWHPEGSVFEHTMQSIDAAAQYIRQNNYIEIISRDKNSTGADFQNIADSVGDSESTDTTIILLLAALCHDCGKAITTDPQTLKSHGHDIAGVDCARALLQRIVGSKRIQKKVLGFVRYHMIPLNFIKNNASDKAYRVLSVNLARCQLTIKMLVSLAYADSAARNGINNTPLDCCAQRVDLFAQRAREAGVFDGPPQQLVQGKDILGLYGEGPIIGEIVIYAYELQVERGISDKDVLLGMVAKKYKK